MQRLFPWAGERFFQTMHRLEVTGEGGKVKGWGWECKGVGAIKGWGREGKGVGVGR